MLKILARILGALFSTIIFMIIAACGLVAYVIYHHARELPAYEQLAEYNPPVVTRLYTKDNRLLEEYAIEHRLFVPIKSIPKMLINGFLSAEDKNFYEHPGVDITSLLRAVFQNINNLSQNRSMVGGSTITQQVVKNFLLTNERSLSRKIKEAILSFRISKAYSKDRILELYLNQIYLGGRSYGVASAALNYFNKSMDELTIEEVAYLAAVPKAPSNYELKRHYDKAIARRNWVIDRMEADGHITREQANAAKATKIELRTRDQEQIVKADFFAESVRREIAHKYGSKTLYEGGLYVSTTIDPKLQKIAEESFASGVVAYDRRHGYRGIIKNIASEKEWQMQLKLLHEQTPMHPAWKFAMVQALEKNKVAIGIEDGTKGHIGFDELKWASGQPQNLFKVGDVVLVEKMKTGATKDGDHWLRQMPKVNGGMVVMNPHTGGVLAMVGGFLYDNSEFNRAMQAKRQPGSTFKPFVYLAALENGYKPTSIIVDGPIELYQGPGLPMWRPKNYKGDFLGPTTLRRGVEKSRNLMTVRLAQTLGINKIIEVTKRFSINEDPPKNYSMVLGAAETTLLKLTNAYAMLVNGGKQVYPSLIERVQDRTGKTIYRHDLRDCISCLVSGEIDIFESIEPEIIDTREMVTDPRTAYQMVSILEGVVQRGTAVKAKALGKTLAGKTGTTNESKDVWFVGFSPDLVVGTYIGYDQPKNLGEKETGGTAALPIFISFMQEALKRCSRHTVSRSRGN